MTEYLASLIVDPNAWIALASLVAMEVVLGIDNLIFISVLTNKLPAEKRANARRIGIGGAGGKGCVFAGGKHTGDVSMGQVTVGWQLGGQAYSELILFKNKDTYDEFTRGEFEFGADATAVALTYGAQAGASTQGASASAGDTKGKGMWKRGMAVFTLAKGGLMYEASIGGQKYSFKPL